jgi:hypothetical protein
VKNSREQLKGYF